jgi:hypothetical protein
MVNSPHWARGWRRVGPLLLVVAVLLSGPPRSSVAEEEPGQSVCPRPARVEPTAWRVEGHEQLNEMRATIARTLKSVEVRAPGLSGDVYGFRAGTDYGLIYARDSATIAPAAQFFYAAPYLNRPVEEFLQLQYDGHPSDPEDAYWQMQAEPGAVSGTIGGADLAAAKMLVTSDEEPSLVHMAYVAFRAGGGPRWLLERQAGKPRIQRLNESMEWLFENRFDPAVGLIKRGHTTDWGDVAVGVGLASRPMWTDVKEWTASIYDQAWSYRALVELAEMNQAVDQPGMVELHLARAKNLRQGAEERLWQPNRGFFRTHIHVPAVQHGFDEDGMVSIANAVAVYSGLAEPTERGPIFRALEQARIAAGAGKPGLTLYPPYPAGFFDYPQMGPGRYQNGAVWDWWGGIQISAEFWNGHAALGREHLDLVASDWARHPGEVLEWQEPKSQRNGGSAAYAGAASTMAEAIIAGLFGVEIWTGGFAATPRLGVQSGGIHAYHPPTGCWLDYWHTYAGDRIAVEWDSNHPLPGRVRVLLPERTRFVSGLLDQKQVAMKTERIGDDIYAVLSTPAPTGKHHLELRLASR